MYYNNRRNKLSKLMENGSILIVNSELAPKKTADQQYPFTVNRNYVYLTGINEPNSALVLIKSVDGQQVEEILFKEKTDPVRSLWDGKKMAFDTASNISGVEKVLDIKELFNYLRSITSGTRASHLGNLTSIYLDLESDFLYSESYKVSMFIQKELAFLQIKNAHFLVAELRMFKDKKEIEKLQQAVDITSDGLKRIRENIKSGLYEYDVEAEFNYAINKHNVITSFDTIAAAGHNATTLHYIDNNSLIDKNVLMVCDLGVFYEHYASDITRTYPVDGKFTKRQRQIYDIVYKANTETMAWLKPGRTWKEFNDYARNILIEECLKIGLISKPEEISKYYYHSVGHFVGLDVHDVGDYSKPIQAGMVVTVEPGLYIAEEGIGVRIEDDVLITETGHYCFSHNIEKRADEIEKLIQNRK